MQYAITGNTHHSESESQIIWEQRDIITNGVRINAWGEKTIYYPKNKAEKLIPIPSDERPEAYYRQTQDGGICGRLSLKI